MTNRDASWELFGIACEISAGSISGEEARARMVGVLERLQAGRNEQLRALLKSERAGHRATLYSMSQRGVHSRNAAARRAERALRAAKAIEVELGLTEGP